MKRIFTNLVRTRPRRETKAEAETSAQAVVSATLQDLSSPGTLAVPQGDDPMSERARSLLLYDAALNPSDLAGAYGIEPWALDTARLIRASKLAKEKLHPADPYDQKVYDAANQAIAKCLASRAYNQADAVKAKLEALTGYPYMPDSLRNEIDSIDWSDWDEAMQFAKTLMEKAKDRGEPPVSPPQGNPGSGNPGGDGDQPDDSWLGDSEEEEDDGDKPAPQSAEAQEEQELKESMLRNPETGAKPRISAFSSDPWAPGRQPPKTGYGDPGELENPDKPDVLPMEPIRKKNGAKRRPEMEGAVPKNWHRFMVDRKIFTGAKVKGGMKTRGTVMVDMSGSMSWTRSDFEEMLQVLPECTVYGYAGYSGGVRGRLVILADRGKMVKMDELSRWRCGKGSNVVDDKALRFLATCSRPRVWISDGAVTGKRDARSEAVSMLCNQAIVAGRIVRVRTAHEAVKKLLGR